ncbi:MAG: MFS transporter [Planctomycetota bacterium]|nr:MAG: MFS transporter [Planctomycetota bacterium]
MARPRPRGYTPAPMSTSMRRPRGAVRAPARREPVVEARLVELLEQLAARHHWSDAERRDLDAPLAPGARLTGREALRIFASQVISRQIDYEARRMRARGEGFYTIGSAGHEGNAAVAAALRPTDPALLHYRSGGFFVHRARQVPGQSPVMDTLLGVAASREEPIAGGRHKVWGSVPLNVPPQTSTIASHLPKAMGLAVALERARRLGLPTRFPHDAVVLCSFGDASLNHATAQSALQATGWIATQRLPVPVLYLCEDNGIGISTPSPRDWVRRSMQRHPEIRYFEADGLDLFDAFETACEAVQHVRTTRRPAFLRLRVVRLLGHAGSDIETTYRSVEEIEAIEARDPLLAGARWLVEQRIARPEELRALLERSRARVQAVGREAGARPRLSSGAEVRAPLAPRSPAAIERELQRPLDPALAERLRVGSLGDRPRHMAMLINHALREQLARYPEALVFGEDVGRKGGVYHVTADLQRLAGRARVFDTLLDETSILGMAIGAGLAGLLPCPEIQYLAYIHNALDQLRGEAASMQFFSRAQYANPMVVRVASLAYQKGFGGHFHNDNSTAALRDIPGLIVACPSRGDDAVGMLRTLFAAARACGSVSCLLEPIALYMRKDLLPGDGAWQFRYPPLEQHVPIGSARRYEPHDPLLGGGPPVQRADLGVISYGNGVPMALEAARELRDRHAVRTAVLDLRWLQPLDEAAILALARDAQALLVLDEGRRSGGVAEPVMALLLEHGLGGRCVRVTGLDTFIPLGDAANLCLPSVASVIAAAERLLGCAPAGEGAS